MAGKYGPSSVWMYVDGYDMIANNPQTLTAKTTAPQVSSHGLGDAWQESTPLGTKLAELSQDGAFWDTTALRSHAALSASVPSTPQSSSRVIALGYEGQTAGASFQGYEGGFTMTYEVVGDVADLTKANVEYSISGKGEPGQVIQEETTKTADWDTESASIDYTGDTGQRVVAITSSSVANPTNILCAVAHGLTTGDKIVITGHSGSTPTINDTATPAGIAVTVVDTLNFTVAINVTTGGTGGSFVRADSADGGSGFQQVTAFSGFSGFIGKFRDSEDDITFADLVTFADVTSAPDGQRVTAAGEIDRYIAFKGDVTGSGSITLWAGFSRTPPS